MTGSLCVSGPFTLDKSFLRWCKQGCIQFVIAKPVLAVMTLAMDSAGVYKKDNWGLGHGFVYIQIVYNVSYTWALYALAIFYSSTETLLIPYNPVAKFVMVKLIVFVSFWQGLAISMLVSFGTMNDIDMASRLQASLICLEMAFAALLHLYAFPPSEYDKGVVAQGNADAMGNLGATVNIKDVLSDTYNNFSVSYREYELQGAPDGPDGGESPSSKKMPGRTVQRSYIISEEGIEMMSGPDGRVRGASMTGNLIDTPPPAAVAIGGGSEPDTPPSAKSNRGGNFKDCEIGEPDTPVVDAREDDDLSLL